MGRAEAWAARALPNELLLSMRAQSRPTYKSLFDHWTAVSTMRPAVGKMGSTLLKSYVALMSVLSSLESGGPPS